jgi:hypothetical protein
MTELTHNMGETTNTPESSQSTFFQDAYAMAKAHPVETSVAIVGTALAGAAAALLTRGESLPGLIESAAGKEVAQLISPATKTLVADGVPITAATRDFVSTSARLLPGERSAAVRGLAAYADEAIGQGPKPLFQTAERAGLQPMSIKPLGAHEININVASATDREISRTLDGQTNPFEAYHQSAYRFLPARGLAATIRTAEGATLRGVDGPSRIVFAADNSIQHVLFNNGASDAEKADLLLQAGYAGLIKTDVMAAEAAAKTQGPAIGFMSRNVEKYLSPEKMQEAAITGAKAYTDMDAKAANGFTDYLTERFGPMTKDSREWGRHIMTDKSSVESAWRSNFAPATDSLIENGLAISPLNRAVASNPSVLKSASWERGATVRGGAEYLAAKAKDELPQGTDSLVTDTWYGLQAQTLSPEVVKTVGVINQAFGEKACADTALIEEVAKQVGANGQAQDYVAAYNVLKGGRGVLRDLLQGS